MQTQSSYLPCVLQLSPSLDQQHKALLALLQRYGWSRFSIVTTTAAGNENFVATLKSVIDSVDVGYDTDNYDLIM